VGVCRERGEDRVRARVDKVEEEVDCWGWWGTLGGCHCVLCRSMLGNFLFREETIHANGQSLCGALFQCITTPQNLAAPHLWRGCATRSPRKAASATTLPSVGASSPVQSITHVQSRETALILTLGVACPFNHSALPALLAGLPCRLPPPQPIPCLRGVSASPCRTSQSAIGLSLHSPVQHSLPGDVSALGLCRVQNILFSSTGSYR